MTIITSQAELEIRLQRAREDIAYWRTFTLDEIMEEVNLKMSNKKELCMK
jgi:hypothetical protein